MNGKQIAGTPLLTVIIPAYNVAPYIKTCLSSVLQQPHSAQWLKVIVVIDGASDATLTIARAIAANHPTHLHLMVQEQRGLSAARNTGLAQVRTDYVTFLDGDDYWCDDYLATVLPVLERAEIDMLEYDASLVDENGGYLQPLKIAATTEPIAEVTRENFLALFRCYAWARIYRTALVRQRLYPSARRFEDTATTPWHYWNSRRTISMGRRLICYRQRPYSILRSPCAHDIIDLAATTAEAADMYATTGDAYWQRVTYRIFQQGCRRLTWQPRKDWCAGVRLLRGKAAGVPPPPGLARWLQLRASLLYVVLLYIKRMLGR